MLPLGGDELAIEGAFERIVLRRLSTTMQAAFRRLAYPGETVGQLASLVSSSGIAGELARFVFHLQTLVRRGVLQISVNAEDRPLIALVPTSSSFTLLAGDVTIGRHALSRFAYLRRSDDAMVLETPLTAGRVVVHDPRLAAILLQLSAPTTAADVCALADDLEAEPVVACLNSPGECAAVDAGRRRWPVQGRSVRQACDCGSFTIWCFTPAAVRAGTTSHTARPIPAWKTARNRPLCAKQARRRRSPSRGPISRHSSGWILPSPAWSNSGGPSGNSAANR